MHTLTAFRFCKANAETAHALLHWRYHLNSWVLSWLESEDHTSPEKIIEREKWSVKKRSEYANKVVDGMEEKGEIRALYRDFKINLEAAREAKVCYSSSDPPIASADKWKKPSRYRDRG